MQEAIIVSMARRPIGKVHLERIHKRLSHIRALILCFYTHLCSKTAAYFSGCAPARLNLTHGADQAVDGRYRILRDAGCWPDTTMDTFSKFKPNNEDDFIVADHVRRLSGGAWERAFSVLVEPFKNWIVRKNQELECN